MRWSQPSSAHPQGIRRKLRLLSSRPPRPTSLRLAALCDRCRIRRRVLASPSVHLRPPGTCAMHLRRGCRLQPLPQPQALCVRPSTCPRRCPSCSLARALLRVSVARARPFPRHWRLLFPPRRQMMARLLGRPQGLCLALVSATHRPPTVYTGLVLARSRFAQQFSGRVYHRGCGPAFRGCRRGRLAQARSQ